MNSTPPPKPTTQQLGFVTTLRDVLFGMQRLRKQLAVIVLPPVTLGALLLMTTVWAMGGVQDVLHTMQRQSLLRVGLLTFVVLTVFIVVASPFMLASLAPVSCVVRHFAQGRLLTPREAYREAFRAPGVVLLSHWANVFGSLLGGWVATLLTIWLFPLTFLVLRWLSIPALWGLVVSFLMMMLPGYAVAARFNVDLGLAVPVAANGAATTSEACSASYRLADGHRWRLFSLQAVAAATTQIVTPLATWLLQSDDLSLIWYWLIAILVTIPAALSTAFVAVLTGLLYVRLCYPELALDFTAAILEPATAPDGPVRGVSPRLVASSTQPEKRQQSAVAQSQELPSIPDLIVPGVGRTVAGPSRSAAPPQVQLIPKIVSPVAHRTDGLKSVPIREPWRPTRNVWLIGGAVLFLTAVGAGLLLHWDATLRMRAIAHGRALEAVSPVGCALKILGAGGCDGPFCGRYEVIKAEECMSQHDDESDCLGVPGLQDNEAVAQFIKKTCRDQQAGARKASSYCPEIYQAYVRRCETLRAESTNPAKCLEMRRPGDLVGKDIQCIRRRAKASGTMEACQSLPVGGYQAACYDELAIKLRSAAPCEAIQLPRLKRKCLANNPWIQDGQQCLTIGDSEEQDRCLSSRATRSLATCRQIMDANDREICVKGADPSQRECPMFPEADRTACLKQKILVARSPAECSRIPVKAYHEMCITRFAEANRSPAICSELMDPAAQRQCRAKVNPDESTCLFLNEPMRGECLALSSNTVRSLPADCRVYSGWAETCRELPGARR